MLPTKDTYPVFEANQVLTNAHLNQEFEYLDEQERLTRANLIGIGIVCGLDIRLEGTSKIHLSKGCGVSSEGYLLMQPEDVELVSWKKYTLPTDLDYPPFFQDSDSDEKNDYSFWELFEADEPNTTPLTSLALDDMVVLLFLELKRDDLRNCSPNSCADRGAEVTGTLRKLLVRRDDLLDIVTKNDPQPKTWADLNAQLQIKVNLPELRMPRYNVPNTSPVSSEAVLSAFAEVFQKNQLVKNVATALNQSYNAFEPVLKEEYPQSPFGTFYTSYHFLDATPTSTQQVRVLQYYYDWFDDLIKAYDEFRWAGFDLMCTCCPDSGLFPRHLMLGALALQSGESPGLLRHLFRPSPALSGCEGKTDALLQLFRRLVEMTRQYMAESLLRMPAPSNTLLDSTIRITPSKLADVPLSQKAIPYYYAQNGTPPLFQLWSVEKTLRGRAHQNLSYRAPDYNTADSFVREPLKFDLEPYNFLRIEGHLGKDVQDVMTTLLSVKSQYRLPIEIIALRTGAFDENIPVDLSKESCRFEDLETLYDSLREELQSTLSEGVMHLYNSPINSAEPGGTPKLSLLTKYAPTYTYPAASVGAWYEKHLANFQSKPYIDVDQEKIEQNDVLVVYCLLFWGTTGLPEAYYPHAVSIYYLSQLSDILPPSLDQLDFADFKNKYEDLLSLIRYFRSDAVAHISPDLAKFIPQEDLIDHCDQVLFSCKLEPVRSVCDEYLRRIREVKKQQFLTVFLDKNPGIQHKAGVPLGGTFIVVYHDLPEPLPAANESFGDAASQPGTGTAGSANNQQARISAGSSSRQVREFPKASAWLDTSGLNDTIRRIQYDPTLMASDDIRALLGSITGMSINQALVGFDIAPIYREIFTKAVRDISDGTVIADFFLPYICCSDCSPVQFVLPKAPINFSLKITCTGPDNKANVQITPIGGQAPYSVDIDDTGYKPLQGALFLDAGPHTLTLVDSQGTESAPQNITVPGYLSLQQEVFKCRVGMEKQQFYTVECDIVGGTPPYKAVSGTIIGNKFTSDPVQSGQEIPVKVTDREGCSTEQVFQHNCPPVFSVQLSCTDAKGKANAEVNITAGEGPFAIYVDNQPVATRSIPLTVGMHTFVVQDKSGTRSEPQKITVPPAMYLSAETPNCILSGIRWKFYYTFDILGGTPPYKVNGVTIEGNHVKTVEAWSGSPLTVTVTDHAGCTFTRTFQHNCLRKNPDIKIDVISVRGASQELRVQPDFGTAPYEYNLNDKGFLPLTASIPVLPGEYALVIRDAEGVETEVQRITVEPPPLELGAETLTCVEAGGQATRYTVSFDILGGLPPYKADNGKVEETAYRSDPVPNGQEFQVTITDAAGNAATKSVRHECPTPTPAFTVTLEPTNPNNEAQVLLDPTAGIQPFEYKVDDGAYQPLTDRFLLHAGLHTLTIRDINGTESAPQELDVPEFQTPLSLGQEAFTCLENTNQYAVMFDIRGGTPPYQTNQGTIKANQYFSDPVPNGQEFQVAITDAAGNTAIKMVRYECPVPTPAFTVTLEPTNPNNEAQVLLDPTAGIQPFEYKVDDGAYQPLTDRFLLHAGLHTLTIRDINGTESAPQQVQVPAFQAPLDLGPEIFDCLEDGNHILYYDVRFDILGGVPPYTANQGSIDGAQFNSGPIPNGLEVQVIITDAAGNNAVKVIRHECPIPQPEFDVVPGCTDMNGLSQVAVTIRTGAPPFLVSIDKQPFKPLPKPLTLTAGAHTLVLRDANGGVSEPKNLQIPTALALTTAVFECLSNPDGKPTYIARLGIIGGTPPYHSDQGVIEGNKFTGKPVASGASFTLTVTDSAGCSVSKPYRHDCPVPKPVFTPVLGCTDANRMAPVTLNVREGAAPYWFRIDNGEFQPLVNPVSVPAGTHTITVRDANNALSDPLGVAVPEPIMLGRETYKCQTETGAKPAYTVSFDIQGGTPPYQANSGQINGTRYTSGPVASGQSLELTISDSAKCQVSQTYRHDCPVSKLVVLSDLGPTNAGNYAKLVLTVKSGKAPFQFKTDEQQYQPLPEAISLPSGDHIITVRDADGVESGPLKVQVPHALTTSPESYDCTALADGQQAYSVKFNIEGGVPPYQVSSGKLFGNIYKSDLVKNTEVFSLEIIDARGTRIERIFKHDCPPAPTCTLPCDGLSLRSGYRLWLAEASKGAPYTRYEINAAKFVFDGPSGKKIDLSKQFTVLIQATPDSLNSNFAAAIKGWTDKINAVIAQAAGMKDWLRLDFTPTTQNQFATLWIEHFECLSFDIQVNVSTSRLEGKEKYLFEYSREGTEVTPISAPMPALQAPFLLPPYHRMEKNKCVELTTGSQLEWKPLAQFFNLRLAMQKDIKGADVFLTARTTQAVSIVRPAPLLYLWQLEDAAPVVAMGETAQFRLLSPSPAAKNAILVAFNPDGASVMTTDTINLPPGS